MVATITNLALGEHGLNVRPCLALRCITQKVHDDGALANRGVYIEQVRARHPSILHSFLPAGSIFPHTDDDVQAIVAKVQPLTVALRAVADQCKRIILEVFLQVA